MTAAEYLSLSSSRFCSLFQGKFCCFRIPHCFKVLYPGNITVTTATSLKQQKTDQERKMQEEEDDILTIEYKQKPSFSWMHLYCNYATFSKNAKSLHQSSS